MVLAYYPKDKLLFQGESIWTLYPEDVAKAPPRFAIDKRNRWMLKQSDVVIVYVEQLTGGAARYDSIAQKQQKRVINLADR